MQSDGPTGLLTPELHQLTEKQWGEWNHWLALCTEAAKQGEGHFLDAYLDMAKEAGYSHLTLYTIAAREDPRLPTSYDRFHLWEERSRERARQQGISPTPASEEAQPSRP